MNARPESGLTSRPLLLDLFCGAGGAARGYRMAGFETVGVDIVAQPNYYGGGFVQHDAMLFLDSLLDGLYNDLWPDIVAIHASPPCQAYSTLNAYNRKSYPDLVGPVRDLLEQTGLPYVIENVPQAPLRDPVTLCGAMFDLRVYRHRGFEANFPVAAPPHPKHTARCVRNGYLPAADQFMSIHGGKHSKAWQKQAAWVMGTPWMETIPEVCEAIPPVYTEHVGGYLMGAINEEAKAA